MEKKTAVEYLISVVKSPEWQDMYIWHKEEVFKTALAMEREQKTQIYSEDVCPSCGSYDWSYHMSIDKMKCGDCGKIT
jgi:hypothetical protein